MEIFSALACGNMFRSSDAMCQSIVSLATNAISISTVMRHTTPTKFIWIKQYDDYYISIMKDFHRIDLISRFLFQCGTMMDVQHPAKRLAYYF